MRWITREGGEGGECGFNMVLLRSKGFFFSRIYGGGV